MNYISRITLIVLSVFVITSVMLANDLGLQTSKAPDRSIGEVAMMLLFITVCVYIGAGVRMAYEPRIPRNIPQLIMGGLVVTIVAFTILMPPLLTVPGGLKEIICSESVALACISLQAILFGATMNERVRQLLDKALGKTE